MSPIQTNSGRHQNPTSEDNADPTVMEIIGIFKSIDTTEWTPDYKELQPQTQTEDTQGICYYTQRVMSI